MLTNINLTNSYQDKSALVVEPSDVLRSAIVKMLRELGFYPINQALSITEAKRILAKSPPDVIVSERELNGSDGIELLQWCRNNKATTHIPFIFCTSIVEQLSVIKALKAGVSEYIAKPFSFISFKKHLAKAFKQPLNSRFEEQFSHKVESGRSQLSITSYSQRAPELKASTFTILVVDDNPNNINIITKAIKSLGRVKFATHGQMAIDICNEFPPDLILLDIMMPNMNGYQVFEQLKKDSLTSEIPVIFVTAKMDEEDIIKGLSMGAVDYITKPINNQILSARVLNQKKNIENQKMMQNQIETYVDSFALKADLERILFDHVKTPLNNLHDIAFRLMQKNLTQNQAFHEGTVLDKARITIERMIESLSSMVKIEDQAFKPTLSSVNIEQVTSKVSASLHKEIKEKSLSFNSFIPRESFVQADEVLLSSMFNNLLLNAIEAAPRGSELKIFYKREEGQQCITFYNRGGVDEEIVPRFFDKYVTKGKVNGTGLGTYSAKLITEALQGRIELETNSEETRIHITLNSYEP